MKKIYFKYSPKRRLYADANRPQDPLWLGDQINASFEGNDDLTLHDRELNHQDGVWLGYVEYNTTPKREVLRMLNDQKGFNLVVVGKAEVKAWFDSLFTLDSGDTYWLDEENGLSHTVDTFEYITVQIPVQHFASFAQLATQVKVMFSGVKSDVVNGMVEFTDIESDNPMLGQFLTEELIANVRAVGGDVLGI